MIFSLGLRAGLTNGLVGMQNGSSCRDLMPELMSLPDPDPKVEQDMERVTVMEKPQQQVFADENNSGGRFSNVQSNIDKKLGAIKNIDKVAVKKWFNTNMESLKEHIRVLAADAWFLTWRPTF